MATVNTVLGPVDASQIGGTMAQPLCVTGAVGSPVNPVAIK